MARDKSKNLELRNVSMPIWMPEWTNNNPNEAKLMWLIFAPETSVSKFFNKKLPNKIDDFNQQNNNFKHYDFAEMKWDSYIKMKNEDEDMDEYKGVK